MRVLLIDRFLQDRPERSKKVHLARLSHYLLSKKLFSCCSLSSGLVPGRVPEIRPRLCRPRKFLSLGLSAGLQLLPRPPSRLAATYTGAVRRVLAARNRKVANQIPEGLLRREIEAEVVSE